MPASHPPADARPAILKVAIDAPLDRYFDYLPAGADTDSSQFRVGSRVLVPFGKREVVGIITGHAMESSLQASKLRPVTGSLDPAPLLGGEEMELARWLGSYYHYPRGAALASMLPNALRRPVPARAYEERRWRATRHALGLHEEALKRAPKQQALLRLLAADPGREFSDAQLAEAGIAGQVALELEKKGLAERCMREALPASCSSVIQGKCESTAPRLNPQQRDAISQIEPMLGDFSVMLLEGVTGSGKTEIYLAAIAQALARNEQSLVLVPEIGLTPQTIARFANRFDCQIAVFHSGLTDRERLAAWLAAARGDVQIVIGTRSAVFTRCSKLGLIIVDEEHDQSYKQQDGLHYCARDVAVKRAQLANVPVVLGSATPSLESIHNAKNGRYLYAKLDQRAAASHPPQISFIDVRRKAMHEGLSDEAIAALSETLSAKRQGMVFINRRGFAPVLLCHDCGWSANCGNCDARMTLHRKAGELRCHHCEHRERIPQTCPRCQSRQLLQLGQGTERLADALKVLFPGTEVLRIDSDALRGKQAFARSIDRINQGEPLLLVGTQMLAKGHDFKSLDTVVMLDMDQGLYNPDFRAAVKTLQLLEQVAGRAGRASGFGRVLVQTHLPDHPLLQQWSSGGYLGVRDALLEERRERNLPPYTHMAVLRADSSRPRAALALLHKLQQRLQSDPEAALQASGVRCESPAAAFMERRAGRHRAQMTLCASHRAALHHVLQRARAHLQQEKLPAHLRFSIDVDPHESG